MLYQLESLMILSKTFFIAITDCFFGAHNRPTLIIFGSSFMTAYIEWINWLYSLRSPARSADIQENNDTDNVFIEFKKAQNGFEFILALIIII
jgi:hypothetical protein